MCGIGGWLGHIADSEIHAARMTKVMHHRGPDAHGIRSWREATLVHTRLSIIDLSPTGAQPMPNEDETVWTVFNGEIYNHRELRRDLEKKGHIFSGHSDTEVLPRLYEEDGPDFVKRLRGMFALAIFDTRTRKLILARDRFGIKPLFYAPGRDCLVFASEIPALLQMPAIDTRPNNQAVADFSALHYIPAPDTFYMGIRALQAGELLIASLNTDQSLSWKVEAYHKWEVTPDYEISLGRAVETAEELVSAAVGRQLESDVALGALLSGGIDSSLVSVAAQRALGGSLKTFNVSFSDQAYDETWAAMMVAKHITSHHESLDMGISPGSWEQITGLLRHAGQPFADTSLFAVNAVCRLMRQHVTVAVSGDGGDEAFGGYDVYWRLARIAKWQKFPSAVIVGSSIACRPLAALGILSERIPHRMRDLATADDAAIIQSLFSHLTEAEHVTLCDTGSVLPLRRLFEPQWEHNLKGSRSRLERLSALATEINTRLLLANDFLFKVDSASMKESLEVRVPMLDEDLFAFGLSLPHGLKVIGRTCKRILRGVAGRWLPPAVANKPKWGFSVPLDIWIGSDVKENIRETLLSNGSGLSGFFRPEVYKPWIEAFCDNRLHAHIPNQELYPRVIMLLAVHLALTREN